MKLTRKLIRETVRKVMAESKITPEPPFAKPHHPNFPKLSQAWNAWFWENTRDWVWRLMPAQKGWNDEKYPYDFRVSNTGGAEISYGSFGWRWSKYRNNLLRLSVFPEDLASDIPAGIYIHFEIGLGGTRNRDARSMAELYFPFKKYKGPNKSGGMVNKGMSIPEFIEELSFYHDEIVECMRILTPLGSKTVKSFPPTRFYSTVWPKLEKYAAPGMDAHIRSWKARMGL